MKHTDSITATRRFAAAGIAALGLTLLVALFSGTPTTFAAGGDFSAINFAAAAPQTYDHMTGGGSYNDGTIGVANDTVESLEGGEYACGDVVTFLILIEVDPTPVDANQTIQLDFNFTADTTGQSGAAFTEVTNVEINYGQRENGDDGTGINPGAGSLGLDSAINDDRQTVAGGDTGVGGSTATLTSQSLTGPIFTSGSDLLASVTIDDLEAGESVVLRIDVMLLCQPGSNPTGNLQGSLADANVIEADSAPVDPPDAISGGAQTIPFKQVGDLAGAGEPLLTISKTVTTANGTCGVDDVEVLTVSAGEQVKYCYEVCNPGTADLFDVEVIDDNGTPGDTSDDFMVTLLGLADLDGDADLGDLASGACATGTATLVPGSGATPLTLAPVRLSGGGEPAAGSLRTLAAAVNDPVEETVVNTADASGNNGRSGGNFEELFASDTATVNTQTFPVPQLVLSKTVTTADGTCPGTDNLTVTEGDTVKYCYTVSNPGEGVLLDLVVVDDNGTPGDTSDDFTVTLSGLTDEDGDGSADDLAAGATATGEALVTLDTVGTVTNTATGSGNDGNGNDFEDTDTATVTVDPVPVPQRVVAKTVTTENGTCPGADSITVTEGDTVKYCYTVSNPGDGAAFDVVLVDDAGTPGDSSDDFTVALTGLTDEDGDGSADDLGAGASATGEALVTLATAGTVINTATATGNDGRGGEVEGSDTATTVVEAPPQPELVVRKTVTTESGTCPGTNTLTVTEGDTVKYCYEVSNPGLGDLFDVVLVDDAGTPGDSSDDFTVLLTGLTDEDGDGAADDLAAGATATGEALVTLDTAGTVTNTATASGNDGRGGELSDSDTASVLVEQDPGPGGDPVLVLSKTVTTADGTCGVDDVENLAVQTGTTVKYCYVVTNFGNGTLFDVVVVDDNATPGDPGDDFVVTLSGLADLDGEGDALDLAAGGTATGEVLRTVVGTNGQVILNLATATGNDGRGGDSTFTDPATVVIENAASPAPVLSKTVTTEGGTCPGVESIEAQAGDTVKYCYVLTNVGTGPMFNVVLTDDAGTPADPADDFPVTLTGLQDLDGDGSGDDLAAGATATGEALVTLTSFSGSLSNTATASGNDGFGGPLSVTDTATVTPGGGTGGPCVDNPLGTAGLYNIFVFGDISQSNVDTGGRLAAGGDANFLNYGVGSALGTPVGDTLVVGGNLVYTNGSVNGPVAVGGTADLNGVVVFNGEVRQDTPIDFLAEQAFLTSASAFWGSLAPTGTTTFNFGSLVLEGTDPEINIFSVSGADLIAAWSLQVTVPPGSSVLINVDGAVGEMKFMSFSVIGTTREKVFFNFFEATSLVIEGVGVEGTVLAPFADIQFNNSGFNGNLVGASVTGNGEAHNFPPDGCLPALP